MKGHGEQDKGRGRGLVDSVRDALAGLAYVFRTQRNMRLHGAAVVLVLVFAWSAGVDGLRWGLLLVAIAGVVSTELLNTAIEAVVDLYTEDYHPLAKVAKDVAAGAVLVQAVVAVALGYIVFAPHIPKPVAVLPVGLWAVGTVTGLRRYKEVQSDDRSSFE